MKRVIIILALLVLLVSPVVLAEGNVTEQATEGLSALGGGLNSKTENILEREVDFPQILEVPLKIILGIEEDATWQELIVVLGVFIGFFILILNIAELVPFFGKGILKALISFVITALVSITGTLDAVAIFFFNIAGFFKWTASWGPLRMIIAIIIAIVVIYAFNKVANMIKEKVKIKKAEQVGKKLKEGSKSAETFSKAQEKLTK